MIPGKGGKLWFSDIPNKHIVFVLLWRDPQDPVAALMVRTLWPTPLGEDKSDLFSEVDTA